MTDRCLSRAGSSSPRTRRSASMAGADVLIEGDRIAAVGQGCPRMARGPSMRSGDIVIPGFIDTHRHTWETSIRTCAPDFTLIAYFAGHPRQVRAELPARRRLRRQPVGLARVHQCRDHDACRLVAHHELAGPRRCRDPRPPGVAASGRSSPSASRTPRSQDWWFGPDYAGSVLIDRRRPAPAGSATQYFNSDEGLITMALATRGPNFCQRGGRTPGLGAREGARSQHHGPRGDVPVRLHQDAAASSFAEHGPPLSRTRRTSIPRT